MLLLALLLAAWPAGPAGAVIFNDILPGARPMSMGAFTAVADDANAMFWNPGGLAGTDFTATSLSMGRMFSPIGPLGFVAGTYSRPFPLREASDVGAGFLSLSEAGGASKDAFILHYSEAVPLPQFYLTRPLKAGVNAKIISTKGGAKGAKSTLGVDAGAVAETNFGLKGGIALLDLTQEIGLPQPTLAFGLAQTWQDWITFAADMRARKGLAQFYPGVEMSFYQGLLKARMGKGVPLHGVSQVALGAGVNFAPVIVDFAMSVPWNGIIRSGGACQMSVQYRFDAPPFYGRFVGSAARQAEDLKSELMQLDDRRRTLDAQVTAAQASKDSVDGQLRSMEGRARVLQEELRSLEIKVDEKRYELHAPEKPAPPPAPKLVPKAAAPKHSLAPYPRNHRVAAGETLRSIASQEYGDPSLWELIYQSNPDKIDRGLPREGEVLLIPAPSK